jgi:hypothetical protein
MDDADCKAVFTQRRKGAIAQRQNLNSSFGPLRLCVRKVEVLLVMLTLLAGTAFLTKMCYLSLAFNTAFVMCSSRSFIITCARA